MEHKKILLSLILLLVILFSCESNRLDIIELSNPSITHLPNLSSASGIEYFNNNYYIVGDDTPWLYILDKNLGIINKIKLSNIDSMVNGRTPKYLKADFECIGINTANNSNDIVVVSSGSLTNSRDTAYILNIDTPQRITAKNIRPLFEKIKNLSKLPAENEINIEGVTFSKEYAFLFHRGNVSENFIIRIGNNEFTSYLRNESEMPTIEIFWFDLPVYNGVSSGFSGACLHPNKEGIIFTASMEDTGDEINDGEVLGSYIGYISLKNMSSGNYISALLTKDEQPLRKKLESISVINKPDVVSNGKALNVIAVSDNDNGTSDVLELRLTFK